MKSRFVSEDSKNLPQRLGLVATTTAPGFGPHSATLGLASSVCTTQSAAFANDMFIGQHGSRNRLAGDVGNVVWRVRSRR